MIRIHVETKKHAIVNTTRRAAFEFLRQVEAMALLMPDVERTQTLSGDRFSCVLKRQSSLGISFQGNYVCEYKDNGKDEVSWTTPEGNMKSIGTWQISGRDGAVNLALEIATEVDLPLPRFLRFPTLRYAELQASRGVDLQLATIRARLEAQQSACSVNDIEAPE